MTSETDAAVLMEPVRTLQQQVQQLQTEQQQAQDMHAAQIHALQQELAAAMQQANEAHTAAQVHGTHAYLVHHKHKSAVKVYVHITRTRELSRHLVLDEQQ